MRVTTSVLAGALAVSGLLVLSGSSWAQTAEERAALRLKTEKQVTKLEEKAANVSVDVALAGHVKVATRLLEAAHKALDNRNEAAAKMLADQAGQMLKMAVAAPGAQQ